MNKKVFLLFLLFHLRAITLFAQDINSSSPIVLPQSPATSYVVPSGQTVKISSAQSITLGPGTWLQQGSIVTMEISNSPIIVPAPSNPSLNLDRNWTQFRTFDDNGTLTGESKLFSDNNGRVIQNQVRSISAGHILATQTLYDAFGRPVVQTLAAPTNNSAFNFKEGFVVNPSGGEYLYPDFDLSKTNAPNALGNSNIGSLGWYYSNNNTFEKYQATTGYPYTRQTYFEEGTEGVKKNAGIGEQLKNGSDHEVTSYTVPVVNELNHYLQVRNKFFSEDQIGGKGSNLVDKGVVLNIGTDENGEKGISVSDATGKLMMSGRSDALGVLSVNNSVVVKGFIPEYIHKFQSTAYNHTLGEMNPDIGPIKFNISSEYNVEVYKNGNFLYAGIGDDYLPGPEERYSSTYEIKSSYPFLISWGDYEASGKPKVSTSPNLHYFYLLQSAPVSITGRHELFNMASETKVIGNTSLPAGYYKLKTLGEDVTLNYSYKINDVSYKFYNQLGQLIASIAPEGVKALISKGLDSYSTLDNIPYISRYEYDLQGRLIANLSTDAGKSEIVYRKDGKIRFSQNAEQVKNGRFSYTNYDVVDRPIESGEYLPGNITFALVKTNSALQENTAGDGGLTSGTKKSVVKTLYDSPDNSHGLISYVQDPKFLEFAISCTENADSKTWYNYDEKGQVRWIIKKINGLDAKTIDYTYLANGKLQSVDYQKNTPSERFVHHYEYDADLRLVAAYTSLDNLNKTLQAKYYYYLHGPLKRVELGNKLQGIDYTYTPQGWLKSINHPNGDTDPGKDGIQNGFSRDAFAMTLEYFNGDYSRSNTGINSLATQTSRAYYNGNIIGQSWKSLKPSAVIGVYGTGVNNPAMFTYEYKNNYELDQNKFGTPNFDTNGFNETLNGANREFGLKYDAHGNIQNLSRSNSSGVNTQFAYHYIPNTNKLQSVDNYATYNYNDIGEIINQNKVSGQAIYLSYDVFGKVTGIYNDAARTQLKISFGYDESGLRIRKTDHTQNITTYYLSDGSGNVLSIYDNNGTILKQKQIPLYASGRIGIYNKMDNNLQYELADHLGNVRAVINQNKSNGVVDVLHYSDYYPFGSNISLANNDYRYGYQGQYAEVDKETGWNNFEARMYDSGIGRWMSTDPAEQFDSPYIGMGNNPVSFVDADGEYSFVGGFLRWAGSGFSGGFGKDRNGDRKGEWFISSSVDNRPGEWGASIKKDYGDNGAKFYPNGTISTYNPDLFHRWSDSDNFLAKLSYKTADGFYLGFGSLLPGSSQRHLNGQSSLPKERIAAFINSATSVAPLGRSAQLIPKLNAAEFSSLTAGTFVARLQPATRGVLNKTLNWITSKAKILTLAEKGAKKLKEANNENNKK